MSALAEAVGTRHDLVSKHLSEMLRCEMVVRGREGNFALYSLPDSITIRAVALMARSVVQHRERLALLAAEVSEDANGGASRLEVVD